VRVCVRLDPLEILQCRADYVHVCDYLSIEQVANSPSWSMEMKSVIKSLWRETIEVEKQRNRMRKIAGRKMETGDRVEKAEERRG
jgi:hypothetical protein